MKKKRKKMKIKMKLYQIGKISKKSGVSIDTIRYYEKLGLMAKPIRTKGGFRMYPASAIARLQFIKAVQEVGFALKEIKEVIRSRRRGFSACYRMALRFLNRKSIEVKLQLRKIQKIRRKLKSLLLEWTSLNKHSKNNA